MPGQSFGKFEKVLRIGEGRRLKRLAEQAAYITSLKPDFEDLSDADLRHHLETQTRKTRTALRDIVRDAVREAELASTVNPGELARTVEAVVAGAMMGWAVTPEGSAAAWIRRDLDAVLKPYLVKRPKRRA